MSESWHILPNNDLKEHNHHSDFCKCNPEIKVQPNGNKLVVHNSWDGREFLESDNKNLYGYSQDSSHLP